MDQFRVGANIDIKMHIKPRFVSGVLLSVHGRKDYLLLQMVDGAISFTVDNGRGPISSTFKPPDNNKYYFCDGNWHFIHGKSLSILFCKAHRLTRTTQELFLSNSQLACHIQSHCQTKQMPKHL